MNLLSLDKVSKSNGNKLLFKEITFGLDEGFKAALIGVNGSGKTTLLRMIAGTEKTDSGTLSKNKALQISFLEQNPDYDKNQTILDLIFKSDNPRDNLVRRYEALTDKLAHAPDDKTQNELQKVITEMEELKIWDYESEIRSLIENLGITDLSLKMGELSGGMLKKVFLAKALIGESNMLLLDEPTNHLDMDTVLWLQDYLQKSRKAMIMVTHDRYFLDNVCNTLYEIDRLTMTTYQGNYTFFLEKKAEMEELLRREDQKIKGILRTELEWLKRGPKARATKQKARIERIHELAGREKYDEGSSVELTVAGRRLGNKILEVKNISKSFEGRPVIKDFTHTFRHQERLGFLGPNGSGKTTLLNLITGKLQPDSGTVEKGIHTHFGYFDQHAAELKPDKLLIETVKDAAEVIDLGNGLVITASKMLERFLFPSEQHYTPVGQLSGGEKRRLYLLTILMQNPNFLILDEPTNDLDIKTLSVLEDFLIEFGGCLIMISHDRYILDRTVDTLFLFDGNTHIKGFAGTCSDYLEEKAELKSLEASRIKAEKRSETKEIIQPDKTDKPKAKMSFKEKQDLEKLPAEIDALEKEKQDIESHFSTGVYDPDKMKAWNTRFEEIKTTLEHKYKRWEELLDKST